MAQPRAESSASSRVALAAAAVLAYAGADVVHELLGHAVVARLRGIEILSISSVAIQTATSSRAVAAAGTIADLAAGALALLFVSRWPSMTMAVRLAREEGLFAGTSTGGNVIAALRLADELGPHATVVTIMCDTGMKYLSRK